MEVVRKAYKRMALHNHPDKKGSANNFIRLTEAFERVKKFTEMNECRANQTNDVDYQMYRMMFEKVMTLLKNAVSSFTTTATAVAADTVVPLTVGMDELYRGEVKKLVVSINGHRGVEKRTVYIGLATKRHVFAGLGDFGGDLVFHINLSPTCFTIDKVNPAILRYRWTINVTQYMDGINEAPLTLPNGREVSVSRSAYASIYEPTVIDGCGLLKDEDGGRGPLYIDWYLCDIKRNES